MTRRVRRRRLVAQPALDFCRKRASQIILLKSRTDFRDPAEFWQPLVHPADGVFGRHSRRDAALGNLSGIRTGSLGAGSVGVGVGVGLGTTTGLGIVSGISMGSEPG